MREHFSIGFRHFFFSVFALASACVSAGCGGPVSKVYDAEALSNAKNIVVMPAVGAPGVLGKNAGHAQTGVLITTISALDRYDVQGPAKLARFLRSSKTMQDDLWLIEVQANSVKEIGGDLLAVCEVADLRATSETKHSDWSFGQSEWTESTYHATVTIRLIRPEDGKIVYLGYGTYDAQGGFGPALIGATEAALAKIELELGPVKKPDKITGKDGARL